MDEINMKDAEHTLLSVLIFLLAISFCPGMGLAQKVKIHGVRKIVSPVNVTYPKMAKEMRLVGVVKVMATVAPNGKVTKTHLIGGSPVFVPFVVDAIMLSRWEPEPQETQELVEVEFSPRQGE
jgi:hypothetical protein